METGGGGGGIRTPGELPHNGFQDRRLRPLGHSSANPAGLDGPLDLSFGYHVLGFESKPNF